MDFVLATIFRDLVSMNYKSSGHGVIGGVILILISNIRRKADGHLNVVFIIIASVFYALCIQNTVITWEVGIDVEAMDSVDVFRKNSETIEEGT